MWWPCHCDLSQNVEKLRVKCTGRRSLREKAFPQEKRQTLKITLWDYIFRKSKCLLEETKTTAILRSRFGFGLGKWKYVSETASAFWIEAMMLYFWPLPVIVVKTTFLYIHLHWVQNSFCHPQSRLFSSKVQFFVQSFSLPQLSSKFTS